MLVDGFDVLPLPGSETGDSTLFIDAPDKLSMSVLVTFLAMMGLGQATFDISDGTGNGYILSSFFFILCVFSTLVSIKLYFSALEKDLSPTFSAMVVNHAHMPLIIGIIITCLVLTVSGLIFRAQIRFSAFLVAETESKLDVLFRFVAILMCVAYSIPVVFLWKRTWIKWVTGCHVAVIVLYVILMLLTIVHFKGTEPEIKPTQRAFPNSFSGFTHDVCFNNILFIFPNVHGVANMLKNGRMKRCIIMTGGAVGVICGGVALIGLLEFHALAKVGSDPVAFCSADYLPTRLAGLMSVISQVMSIPYFCVPLFDMTSALFRNVRYDARKYQSLIIAVSTVSTATLLALWNLGAQILNVFNTSCLMPIVMFIVPCLMHRESCGEDQMTGLMKFCCVAFATLQVIFGVFRFASLFL